MRKTTQSFHHSAAPTLHLLKHTHQATQARPFLKQTASFLIFCFLCLGLPVHTLALQSDQPRVRGISVQKLTIAENDPTQASIVIEISGEKFGKSPQPAAVKLINQDTGATVDATIVSHNDSKIVASAQVPVGAKASKYVFQVSIDNVPVIAPDHLSDYAIEFKREKKDDHAKPFEITFETFKSEQYPNLYSLLITNKTAGSDPGFSSNPSLMKVDIVPAGATNVSIQPGGSPQKLLVTFLAPEKFEVKDVLVTVFDPNTTLGDNKPKSYSTQFKEKPPKGDPNQPTISNIEILSMQRRSGFGRLKIEGSGFGEYERPPITGEKELLCCGLRPMDPEVSPERTDEAGPGKEVCESIDGSKCREMRLWRKRIEERVNVMLVPRNPDLRVERTQIMYIDDKTVDVYFEFTFYTNYSEPFRLASASLTVNKGAVQEIRDSDPSGDVSAVLAGPQTYVATREVGPPRDKNLEYRYVILEQNDASRLFGRGVGDYFYVIELAVVNNGKKKVAVPLASIQAEIEWRYGEVSKTVLFEEGPPTIPPLTLGSVSSYFDAFQKRDGKWARVFNILDGLTTLGAALVPVFGHNIERPTTILSGGLIPALRKGIGDLSSQQLQNLTTMSWENIEEVAAGGSKTKYVYIPRADQSFGNPPTSTGRTKGEKPMKIKKQIMNIRGLEVSGFEIVESEQKLATPQQQQ